MTSKRIAFVTVGGFGTGNFSQGIPILNRFVQGIAENHEAVVFSMYPVNADFKESTFKVIAPKHQLSYLRKLIWLIRAFRQENNRNKIALLHAFWGFPSGLFGAVLKLIFRKPLLIHLQGGDSVGIPEINFGVMHRPKKKWLLKWSYGYADQLVVLTDYQKEKLAGHFNRRKPEVIPFGVDRNLFSKPAASRIVKAPYQLLHVGSLNRVKDQKTLLDAVRILSNQTTIFLQILGEDILDGELQRYAETIGVYDMISFENYQQYGQLITYFHQSDLLIHSSLYEGQALVVAEAISTGLPVCGTNVGLISDLSDVCTIASPVGDSEKLAFNIWKVLKDEELYNQKVADGLKWSAEHDIDFTVREFNKLYHKM
ncbi:MAG: glycosyltransferase family 4 protein [Bacteroidota bacterium]